jgi:thymidylate kinase
MAAWMNAHEVIDSALSDLALVYGSLPPGGRDIDVLVRPAEEAAACRALDDAGFMRRGLQWVRFSACTVEIVDLTPAAEWHLPEAELEGLFADARPIDGLDRLARPAPHHVVLILARRVAAGGALDAKRRARLDAALEEDPGAWRRAAERAAAWNAQIQLERLEASYRDPNGRRSRPKRRPTLRRLARVSLDRFRRRGVVIALSGLDGAGKSSQATALKASFERIGHEVEIAWTRATWDDWVWKLGFAVKKILRMPVRLLSRRARTSALAIATDSPSVAEPAVDPIKRLRERSRLATGAWVMVHALANAWSQRRLTRPHLRRGRIVICDRYTLDSIVALRVRYGAHHRFRLQRSLIAALSPRPARAYFLDVRPETAFARKGEGGVEWLAAHRRLYLEEHEALGVRHLDGERPREEICTEIAQDVWALGL